MVNGYDEHIVYEYMSDKFVRVRRIENLTKLGYEGEKGDVTEDSEEDSFFKIDVLSVRKPTS